MTQYVLDVAGLTDQGIKRDHNEDAWSGPPPILEASEIAAKGFLYIVADGVGGHLAGDVASAVAVEIIQQSYYANPSPNVVVSLKAAIHAANQQIQRDAVSKPDQYGMSTTSVAAVLRGKELTVANVGDSRAYLVHKGQTRQVTVDHTWVEEQVQAGLITQEDASRHPHRNIITRSLGSSQEPQVDIFEEPLVSGDSVLLCSDGLSNMIPGAEIGAIVGAGQKANKVVRELIELAKERGAPDNVTAVLIKVGRPRSPLRRWLVLLGISLGLILAVGILALLVLGTGGESADGIPSAPTSASSIPTLAPSPTVASNLPTPSPPPNTPTATVVSLDSALPRPELLWPTEDTLLVAGDPITFAWKLDHELERNDWRFGFVLMPGQDTLVPIREELSLDTTEYKVPNSLEPGEYMWTLSLIGTEARGPLVGRRLIVIQPTPIPQ